LTAAAVTTSLFRRARGTERRPGAPKSSQPAGAQDPAAMGDEIMRCACLMCGYIYYPEKGDPEHGVEPGTEASELPAEWTCPKCKSGQDAFAMMEDEEEE
jgi:rubredoxin